MLDEDDDLTDLSLLAVPQLGSLEATGDSFQPYRLLDAAGAPIPAGVAYFAELVDCGRPATTQQSYAIGPQDLRGPREFSMAARRAKRPILVSSCC